MKDFWWIIYFVPILASVTVLLVAMAYRLKCRRTGSIKHLSQFWHMAIWTLIISHVGIRAVLWVYDETLFFEVIFWELLSTLVAVILWQLLNKRYLRPVPEEFSEAELMLKWVGLCSEILPRKSIPLYQVGSKIMPHTRGCENPIFCISLDLLDSLSDTGQRYIMAHYLYHIKHRHHQYKRLFNFSFVMMWYNPLLHLFSVNMQRDFDEVSDELTIKHFGKNHAGSYGMTLIHTYDLHGPVHPLLNRFYRWQGLNHLKERIARLN